jgi:hypothetical protein
LVIISPIVVNILSPIYVCPTTIKIVQAFVVTLSKNGKAKHQVIEP